MSDRRRSRDQYLYIPKYALNNTNVDRTNEIRKFYQVNFFGEPSIVDLCRLAFSRAPRYLHGPQWHFAPGGTLHSSGAQ